MKTLTSNIAIEITPEIPGFQNMERDLQLFKNFEKGTIGPTLQIYSWKPVCISLGYSQKAEKLLNLDAAREFNFDIVKRPTGGGIVFHNEDEVTYTLILPYDFPGLPKGSATTYKYISQIVVDALNKLGINAEIAAGKKSERRSADLCFTYPAEYEIVANDKKIVGSAQKRGKRGFLQHGSIFVSRRDFDKFEKVLKNPSEAALEKAISIEEVLGHKLSFEEISSALRESFKKLKYNR